MRICLIAPAERSGIKGRLFQRPCACEHSRQLGRRTLWRRTCFYIAGKYEMERLPVSEQRVAASVAQPNQILCRDRITPRARQIVLWQLIEPFLAAAFDSQSCLVESERK